MSQFSYSEKHRRSVSPILKTTTEDRKILHHNKENYIQYLEHQLEKTVSVVNSKYDEKVRNLENIVQDHEEKLSNCIKAVKLIQHFAQNQEQENNNVRRHVNSSIEKIYHDELRLLNQQFHDLQTTIQDNKILTPQQSIFEEFEESINRKIDVMMNEIRKNVLKVDFQELQQKVNQLQIINPEISIKQNEKQENNNNIQQFNEIKIILDQVIKDIDILKINVNTIHNDVIQQSQATLALTNQRFSRKSELRESQQSESEQVLKPKLISPEQNQKKPKTAISSRSISNKKEKKKQYPISQSAQILKSKKKKDSKK